jgi:hypothetical protein
MLFTLRPSDKRPLSLILDLHIVALRAAERLGARIACAFDPRGWRIAPPKRNGALRFGAPQKENYFFSLSKYRIPNCAG